MLFISAHNLQKSFGARTLFKGLSFAVEERERIGLIGNFYRPRPDNIVQSLSRWRVPSAVLIHRTRNALGEARQNLYHNLRE